MKFNIFFSAFILFCLTLNGAFAQSNLKSKPLMVVIDNERSDAGKALMEAFKENWEVTRYQFISPDELEKYIGNEKYAIFLPFTRSYSDDKAGRKYPAMGVIVGGKGCKDLNCHRVKFITNFHLEHEYDNKEDVTTIENYEYLADLIVRYAHFQYK